MPKTQDIGRCRHFRPSSQHGYPPNHPDVGRGQNPPKGGFCHPARHRHAKPEHRSVTSTKTCGTLHPCAADAKPQAAPAGSNADRPAAPNTQPTTQPPTTPSAKHDASATAATPPHGTPSEPPASNTPATRASSTSTTAAPESRQPPTSGRASTATTSPPNSTISAPPAATATASSTAPARHAALALSFMRTNRGGVVVTRGDATPPRAQALFHPVKIYRP